MFIFSCAITHLVLLGKDEEAHSSSNNSVSFVDAIKHSPSSVIVVVICFFSVWSIIGLAGFHTYLATTNLTTNEDIKGSFSSKRNHENFNPYSKGNFINNCLAVLCSPMSPSLLDATGIVTEQYLVANNLVPGEEGSVGGQAGGSGGLGKTTYGTVLDSKPYPVQPQSPQHHLNGQQQQQQQHHQQVLYNQQRQMVQTQTSTTGLSVGGENEVVHSNGGTHGVRSEPPATTELDQTTMIGSALDLDSLNGDAAVASATSILSDNDMLDNVSSTVGTSHSGGDGSQVGLMSPSSASAGGGGGANRALAGTATVPTVTSAM